MGVKRVWPGSSPGILPNRAGPRGWRSPIAWERLGPWLMMAGSAQPRVVLPGESQAALAALPTAALRLSPATVTMLAELGVRQIGPLAALPRDTLLGRFGAEPLWRLDQALAGASDTASAEKAIESLTVQRLFEFATDRLETIAAALDQLLAQLIGLLAGDHRGILRLAGRLDRVGAAPLEFEVGLYRPSVSRRHLLELLRLRLEGLRFAAQRAPVEGLRLTVTAGPRPWCPSNKRCLTAAILWNRRDSWPRWSIVWPAAWDARPCCGPVCWTTPSRNMPASICPSMPSRRSRGSR